MASLVVATGGGRQRIRSGIAECAIALDREQVTAAVGRIGSGLDPADDPDRSADGPPWASPGKEDNVIAYLVEHRDLDDQPTLARRASLRLDRVGPWLAETYAWISTHLGQVGVAVAGPPYARFSFAGDRADVEAGFPVAGSAPVEGDLVRSSLPGGTAAVTTHVGPYEGLQEAYEVVEARSAIDLLSPAHPRDRGTTTVLCAHGKGPMDPAARLRDRGRWSGRPPTSEVLMDPGTTRHPTVVKALNRIGARKPLQRVGLFAEPTVALSSDAPEVAQLLADDGFSTRLAKLAVSLGREPAEVAAEAAGYLREMGAVHSPRVMAGWSRFITWMFRAHDLLVDEEAARRLRRLDREYSLLFLFSHRSYLDGAAVPLALERHGIQPAFTLGGANLNFFPVGRIARQSGIVYIRRSTQDLPVYKLALRAYIGQLIRNRKNLSWSIEGGRTRTGKLRPPTYGIVRYVVDAVEAAPDLEAVIVPVSIVYEQLHEVGLMTAEARGGRKRPEDLRWLVNFAHQQARRLGRAYLDFGEPLPLRERLAELRADDPGGRHIVERVALDTSHRINRATPVTATAVVCLAMLAADRALTLDGVLSTVAPMAGYVRARRWPVAGAADLTDRATIRRTLQELTASGVLTSYDGGTDTVWRIREGQHLVAAFYRNAAIHMLVDRAIGELSLVAAAEGGPDGLSTATTEALRLRDLLKFDFFFARRRDFAGEMAVELAVVDPAARTGLHEFTPADARRWLEAGSPLVAPLVLRPFLDAYHLVADRLVAWEDANVDEARFLEECLRVGRQWAMQGRLGSEESVSLELFKPALRLARHRDLLGSTEPHLHKRRMEFRDEIRETLRRVSVVTDAAQRKHLCPGIYLIG